MRPVFLTRLYHWIEPSLTPLLKKPFDSWLPTLAIGLALFGWVMISSAAIDSPLGMWHFSIRQGIFLLISLIAAWFVLRIPFREWRILVVPFYLTAIGLLIIVLLIGQEINGSHRWINLPGLLPSLQPSEVGKIALALYMARFVTLYREQLSTRLVAFYRPLAALAPFVLLLFMGRDFGSAFIYIVAVGGILILADTNKRGLLIAGGVAILGITAMIFAEPYRVARLMNYQDPWQDPFGSGYQLSQSLIGFARGGLTGLGLGNSIQKLGFLPEPHNDFILAIIAEELGVIGFTGVIAGITTLCYRIAVIGRQADLAQRTLAAFFCYAVAIIFISQMLVNAGVSIGLLPTKGLTLPLISYGGSSLLVSFIMIAMVMRIDIETRDLIQTHYADAQEAARKKSLKLKYRGFIQEQKSAERLPG